jgi:hypothetical protein
MTTMAIKAIDDVAELLGDKLIVTGTGDSQAIHVAVIQNGEAVEGTTIGVDGAWTLELPAEGYEEGVATGVAISVDLDGYGEWPGFQTFTCAKTIAITAKKPEQAVQAPPCVAA